MLVPGQLGNVEHHQGRPQSDGDMDRRSSGEVSTGCKEQEAKGGVCSRIEKRHFEG